ncbi:glycine oxidase ThiO [Nocardioides pyridinolyticus]
MVGAGIVGLACAEELVRAGHDVRVFDPDPGGGATRAAAGMLAPAGEAWHGETDLLRLGVASARLWPAYAARLQATSGVDVDLRTQGTLLVGQDHDDLQQVRRSLEVLAGEGLFFRELDRRGARAEEPTLARVAGAALLPEDHQVNPRRVAEALLRLLGDRVVRARATVVDGGVSCAGGTGFGCDAVVVATGAEARSLVPQVRPVRGETIRLRVSDPPSRVVRARVHGESVYVVPRAGGEIVVGATEEEHAAEPVATLGAVVRLLHAARTVVPGLECAEVLEITARCRPGTPDNGPLLGVAPSPGAVRQVLAVGHYRGGVLLAPLTAQVIRAHVEDGDVPAVARRFEPSRFGRQSPKPADHRKDPVS